MSRMIRRAIPFTPMIRTGGESQQAADHLSQVIAQNEQEGWRFCHLEDVTTVRNNGCLASFTGNPTSVITIQVAIFERDQ